MCQLKTENAMDVKGMPWKITFHDVYTYNLFKLLTHFWQSLEVLKNKPVDVTMILTHKRLIKIAK